MSLPTLPRDLIKEILSYVPILPPNLIKEIFSYLPVKPLVRFTSVSKHYKSLIFEPEFIKLHLQRSPKHAHVLLTLHDAVEIEESWEEIWVLTPCSVRHLLEPPPSIGNEDECRRFNDSYYTIGSTNGLVCLISKTKNNGVKNICVRFWNPTLRLRSKKSPTLTIMPSADLHLGFGYDDSSDTYKVVAVIWDGTNQKWEGRVHCMGDSFWRETLAGPELPVLLELESSVGLFVNGSVNWLARNEQQLVIFSLDLQTETGKNLLLPAGFDEVLHDLNALAVLRGCLCFCYDHLGTHFVLWEMKEFGVQDSWTRLVNVSYMHLQFDNIQHDWLLVPVCLLENEDVLLLVSKEVPDDVIMYNWRDDRVEHIELPGDNQIWYADEHMQSLVVPLPHPH